MLRDSDTGKVRVKCDSGHEKIQKLYVLCVRCILFSYEHKSHKIIVFFLCINHSGSKDCPVLRGFHSLKKLPHKGGWHEDECKENWEKYHVMGKFDVLETPWLFSN